MQFIEQAKGGLFGFIIIFEYFGVDQSHELTELLFEHKQFISEYASEQKVWPISDLIFPYDDGSTYSQRRMAAQMKILFQRAGVPGSTHTLRHTFITNCLHNTKDIKVTSELAGHSSVGMTWDRYGHVLEENVISQFSALNATMRETEPKGI